MKSVSYKLILFFTVLISCNSNYSFRYEADYKKYHEALDCIHKSYPVIFNDSIKNSSISLYPNEISKNNICKNVVTLMKERSIEFANIYKDGTIAFYSTINKRVNTIQYILIFADTKAKITSKITSDMEIIKVNDSGCYELAKVLSVGN